MWMLVVGRRYFAVQRYANYFKRQSVLLIFLLKKIVKSDALKKKNRNFAKLLTI